MNSTLANLTNRMMIGNYDIPLIIVMRPNPQSFNKRTQKMNSQQYTNSGWITNHFGNELDVITIEGFTSAKVREPFRQSNKSTNVAASIVDSFTGKNNTANYGPTQWADIDRFIMKMEQLVKLDKERLGSLIEMLKSSLVGYGLSKITNKISNPLTGGRQDFIASQNTTASQTHSFMIYQYVYYSGYFNSFDYRIDVNDPSRYRYNFEFVVNESSQDWLTKNLITNFPEARVLNLFTQFKDLTNYTSNLISNADQLLKGIFL